MLKYLKERQRKLEEKKAAQIQAARKKVAALNSSNPDVECIGGKHFIIKNDTISSTPRTEKTASWRSTGSRTLLISPATSWDDGSAAEHQTKEPPLMWYYSCNHIMINQERAKEGLEHLIRRSELDEMARKRAKEMALSESLEHGELDDLKEQLEGQCRMLGQNVACGPSIKEMNKCMVENTADRNNMIDPRFKYMGMGTSRANNGKLYLCQLFRD
mmetsp:Transcript_16703/g.24203  ORF Transcript_16703/g.24203 Transcript_16703/m.24203 type:complete len:216 (+) Transcript_16703:15-662(+)